MQRLLPSMSAVRKDFLSTRTSKYLLGSNALLALLYLGIITFAFPIGNPVLFALLIVGEIFHVWQVLTYIYTVWDMDYQAPTNSSFTPPVDIFITVAGEPISLVEQTAVAAKEMHYVGEVRIWLLNDGFVAKKDNWHDVELLAKRLEIGCITRRVPGGAKAGNINNALLHTNAPLVTIFDADHIPHVDFLEKTVPYFGAGTVGFVQTPQFYRNYKENFITKSSWEQQELFFGALCKGKNRLNSATMCGTNMVLSREALTLVGGMCTESIAEDFITGMFIHEKGYQSVYVPEVLAEGLATEDLLTYSKQQFRWARGALDVLFSYNPLFRKGLTWPQKIQYLSSASFYLSGTIVAMNALLPLLFLYFGLVPIVVSGMLLATIFLPYLFLTLYNLRYTTNYTFTFRALAFSFGSWIIHLSALLASITKRKDAFSITSKSALTGNFLPIVRYHILYIAIVCTGVLVAGAREGVTASLTNNIAWGLINTALFLPFVYAALPASARAPFKKNVRAHVKEPTPQLLSGMNEKVVLERKII